MEVVAKGVDQCPGVVPFGFQGRLFSREVGVDNAGDVVGEDVLHIDVPVGTTLRVEVHRKPFQWIHVGIFQRVGRVECFQVDLEHIGGKRPGEQVQVTAVGTGFPAHQIGDRGHVDVVGELAGVGVKVQDAVAVHNAVATRGHRQGQAEEHIAFQFGDHWGVGDAVCGHFPRQVFRGVLVVGHQPKVHQVAVADGGDGLLTDVGDEVVFLGHIAKPVVQTQVDHVVVQPAGKLGLLGGGEEVKLGVGFGLLDKQGAVVGRGAAGQVRTVGHHFKVAVEHLGAGGQHQQVAIGVADVGLAVGRGHGDVVVGNGACGILVEVDAVVVAKGIVVQPLVGLFARGAGADGHKQRRAEHRAVVCGGLQGDGEAAGFVKLKGEVLGGEHRFVVDVPRVGVGAGGEVLQLQDAAQRDLGLRKPNQRFDGARGHHLEGQDLGAARVFAGEDEFHQVGALHFWGKGEAVAAAGRLAVHFPVCCGEVFAQVGELHTAAHFKFQWGVAHQRFNRVVARWGALESVQQCGAQFQQRRAHAFHLAVGEAFKAGQVAVVHEVGLEVQLVTQPPVGHGSEGVVFAQVVLVGVAGVGAVIAENGVHVLVGRRVAHAVTAGEAVVVGASVLEGVVQPQVVPAFVDVHGAAHFVASKGAGLHHNAISGRSVRVGEGCKAHYACVGRLARDFTHHPNVEVLLGVPVAEGFEVGLLGGHQHVGQRRFYAVDAGGEVVFGVACRQAELDVGGDPVAVLVKAQVGKGVVQVVDGVKHLAVGNVLGAVLVDDVHHYGYGQHLAVARGAVYNAVQQALIGFGFLELVSGVGVLQGVQSIEPAIRLGRGGHSQDHQQQSQ